MATNPVATSAKAHPVATPLAAYCRKSLTRLRPERRQSMPPARPDYPPTPPECLLTRCCLPPAHRPADTTRVPIEHSARPATPTCRARYSDAPGVRPGRPPPLALVPT